MEQGPGQDSGRAETGAVFWDPIFREPGHGNRALSGAHWLRLICPALVHPQAEPGAVPGL